MLWLKHAVNKYMGIQIKPFCFEGNFYNLNQLIDSKRMFTHYLRIKSFTACIDFPVT